MHLWLICQKKNGVETDVLELSAKEILEENDFLHNNLKASSEVAYDNGRTPFKIGLSTYIAFITIGLIPLLVYVWDLFWDFPGHLFFGLVF